MAKRSLGGIARRVHFRQWAVATSSLATLAMAGPALAQCATSTAGGVTSLTCGNPVTTNSTNNDPNNPSSVSARQVFATTIDAEIAQGVSVTGFGLRISATGNSPITVTNHGTIANNAALNDAALPRDGV